MKIQALQDVLLLINTFEIDQIDPQTIVIAPKNYIPQSSAPAYLIKDMEVGEEDYQNLSSILETLSLHQDLNSKYLLRLLHYQVKASASHENQTIQAIYEYGTLSLRQQIQARYNSQTKFEEEQVWAILATIVKSLGHLQERGIIYGVLGSDKIFINDNTVKILDPSATATDPLMISQGRLYSPQILNDQQQIDMFKSDVFITGLIILECGLLIDLSKEVEPNLMQLLGRLSQMYSEELTRLVESMLQNEPLSRSSFQQLREYLVQELDMNCTELQIKNQPLIPMSIDQQNCPASQIQIDMEEEEEEICDVLYESYEINNQSPQIRQKYYSSHTLSELQKAKRKYLVLNSINLKKLEREKSSRVRYLHKDHQNLSTANNSNQQSRTESSITINHFQQNQYQTNDLKTNKKNYLANMQNSLQLKKTKMIKERLVRNFDDSRDCIQEEINEDSQNSQQVSNRSSQQWESMHRNKQNKQIFTDPGLMQIIKEDLARISTSKGRSNKQGRWFA